MRVVVTGASGLIGSAVVRVLREAGHDVTPSDLVLPAEPDRQFVIADLMDRVQTAALLRGAEAVCHLGEHANAHVRLPRNEIFSRNATIAPQLMQLAAESGIRKIVYTSSCQVYGTWGPAPGSGPLLPPAELPVDESHPHRPQNVYALSKSTNESYARLLAAHRPAVSIALFRFPFVLGPLSEQQLKRHLDAGVTPTELDGMGTCVDRDDAARAYALWLDHARPGCEAYHFSATEIYALRPLSALLATAYPGGPALPPGWADYQSPLVCEKARGHFGWEPTINPRAAFQSFRHAGPMQ